MATFEFLNPNPGRVQHLREYHTFGRREGSVDTVFQLAYASKLHAVIEWREPNWLLKDLSRNGLTVNDKKIPARTAIVLSVDDIIDVAGTGDLRIRVDNLDAPRSMIYQVEEPSQSIALSDSELLPNEQSPELALYRCPDREQWFTEVIQGREDHTEHEQGPHLHGDEISYQGKEWAFFLVDEDNATTEFTSDRKGIENVEFRFDLSQDEESTILTLIDNGLEIDLGERSHHYLIVHLLRHRLAQQKVNEKPAIGWLDCKILTRELGIDEAHMNIQIFRARKQISSALREHSGTSNFIQRRRGALRAGLANFSIYKEGVKEA